ncbi:response regulator containing a CheY-like receiver domain and an HTH DNA-binding domain [Xenococcus sp. PCC 7305]|uniref:response regulator transcription factor n=1 Tax=Xenococcus sp. PCC 7305 TaxID=102125 RepID=UPI0002ABCA98|nr:response regulator transcription factor [Xenococcus sp. PCC 7305]ELS02617.1 response regulator containing a CheY-like receiver domain and an HTH DNA-binding domain [Xenococcus sp. PCC 7305]
MPLLILIAEDDPGIRLAVHDYLEISGYSVVAAEDGEQALSLLEKYHPHLVISDINMPKHNGYQLIKQIRQLPQFRLLPVIFLTEYADIEQRIKGYQAGCDIYLPKPFEMNELGAIIRNLLERSQIISQELFSSIQKQQSKPQTIIPELKTDTSLAADKLNLTNREQEVLNLLAQGFSNIDIGKELHLSHRTIEKYVSRLLRKTDTNNRAELVRLALENHLV